MIASWTTAEKVQVGSEARRYCTKRVVAWIRFKIIDAITPQSDSRPVPQRNDPQYDCLLLIAGLREPGISGISDSGWLNRVVL